MTLAPESRVLLTDALRPPAGFRVDVAVGTTYSLNLAALLLAPLSFAVFDEVDASDDLTKVDPIRLLEAVRRHAEHTTVFCQASGIHVPGYQRILTFVEDSVIEVTAPHDGAIFHPKVWALRFVAPDGEHRHRVVVLSRNMTLDRSWDTALALDEDSTGTIDAAPAADFVAHLPRLATRDIDTARAQQVRSLASSLRAVRLAAPAPFTEGTLLPIGLGGQTWPFPDSARRLLAISPFLTRPALRALAALTPHRTLVSRAESLDMMGAASVASWDVNVLQRLAEVESGDDVTSPASALTEFAGTQQGLHAKTFVVDLAASRSMTVTGSANLTAETWGHNVEFDAVLVGPTSECGVVATLDGRNGVPGLSTLLAGYTVEDDEGHADPAIETSYVLERFHQTLATGLPAIHVTSADDDTVRATLTLVVPSDAPGTTRVWPASVPGVAHARPLATYVDWALSPENVTPFVVVETTAGEGDARATRRCVLKATLSGEVDGRRQDAVFSILTSKAAVLRYLVFLLGDPSYDALFAQLAGIGTDPAPGAAPGAEVHVALLEPLVRASGRDEDALARVASLVEDLRSRPDGAALVPEGFDALWDVVWQVHREARR